MMDQYFSNDSLESFESIFIGPTELAMAFIWLRCLANVGGTSTLSILRYQWFLMVKCYGNLATVEGVRYRAKTGIATNSDELQVSKSRTLREERYVEARSE